MTRILLTGATGFLGRSLMQHLQQHGDEVIGTTTGAPPGEDYRVCDIVDFVAVTEVMNELKPDVIIHSAAISSVTSSEPLAYYAVNTFGTENVVRAAAATCAGARLIFVSTAGVYGNQDVDLLSETLCPKPVHHYGMSKFSAERVVMNYSDRLDYTIVRPFNIIGPGQSGGFVVPKIALAFARREATIELGNTAVYRDYIDVSDACAIIGRITANPQSIGEICNLCTGVPVSINDLMAELTSITGHTVDIRVNDKFVRANEVWKLLGDCNKVNSLTGGYVRQLSLRESLERILIDYSGF